MPSDGSEKVAIVLGFKTSDGAIRLPLAGPLWMVAMTRALSTIPNAMKRAVPGIDVTVRVEPVNVFVNMFVVVPPDVFVLVVVYVVVTGKVLNVTNRSLVGAVRPVRKLENA